MYHPDTDRLIEQALRVRGEAAALCQQFEEAAAIHQETFAAIRRQWRALHRILDMAPGVGRPIDRTTRDET